MQIIIHAGFHKTGTSSVQKMLMHNAARLKAEFRIVLRHDMVALCETARAFSIAQDPAELGLFAYEAAEFFADQDADDPRPIVLCCEDLSGHMPGRRHLERYASAPILMRKLAEIANQSFAKPPEITFFYSTRAPAPWVQSCYAQHVRATRMTDDFTTYKQAHLAHSDLEKMATEIRAAVAPHLLHISPLEESRHHRLGPLSPLLDLMHPSTDLRASLGVLPPQNTSQSNDIIEKILDLNRGPLADRALADAKKQLMAMAQKAHKS